MAVRPRPVLHGVEHNVENHRGLRKLVLVQRARLVHGDGLSAPALQ